MEQLTPWRLVAFLDYDNSQHKTSCVFSVLYMFYDIVPFYVNHYAQSVIIFNSLLYVITCSVIFCMDHNDTLSFKNSNNIMYIIYKILNQEHMRAKIVFLIRWDKCS